MKIRWQTEWPLWLLLAGMGAAAAANWNAVPDQIPMHWNLSGEVDRFGGRVEGLLLFPIIGVVTYFVFLVAPRVDPARANYPLFAGAYSVVRLVTLLALAALQALVILSARGRPVNMSLAVPLIVGPVMVVIGAVMGRLQPNWFIGIRTPWTLTSTRSWKRTHRAGGWLFVFFGILLMSSAFMRAPGFTIGMVAVMAAGALGLVVYSYVEWKRDPDAGSR